MYYAKNFKQEPYENDQLPPLVPIKPQIFMNRHMTNPMNFKNAFYDLEMSTLKERRTQTEKEKDNKIENNIPRIEKPYDPFDIPPLPSLLGKRKYKRIFSQEQLEFKDYININNFPSNPLQFLLFGGEGSEKKLGRGSNNNSPLVRSRVNSAAGLSSFCKDAMPQIQSKFHIFGITQHSHQNLSHKTNVHHIKKLLKHQGSNVPHRDLNKHLEYSNSFHHFSHTAAKLRTVKQSLYLFSSSCRY